MTARVGVQGFAFRGQVSGVARYLGELLRAAAGIGRAEFTVVTRPGRTAGIEPGPGINLRPTRHGVYEAFRLGSSVVPFEAVAGRQDAMLFGNYVSYRTLGTPFATVIYDLSYLACPEAVDPRFINRLTKIAPRAVERSDLVITISDAVAAEIATAYPGAGDRVRVIRPGTRSIPVPKDWKERLEDLGLEPGYLLHVGTLEPRKNLQTLVEASAAFPVGCPLVLVGPDGWSNGALHDAIDGAGDRVQHVAFVADPDLASLYEGAAMLVYPSQYEGFGLPVTEAMTAGVPVACSDIPVLREAGGRAAVYFDHTDPDSISHVVRGALADPEKREAMSSAGRAHAARSSWDGAGRRLLDVVEELVEP